MKYAIGFVVAGALLFPAVILASTCASLSGTCKEVLDCTTEGGNPSSPAADDCPAKICCISAGVLCAKDGGGCSVEANCNVKDGGFVNGAINDCGKDKDGKQQVCCKKGIEPLVNNSPSGTVAIPKPVTLKDPLDIGGGSPGIIGVISRFIGTFLGVVGALALLVFVYAGIVYMTAGGSDERVKEAKDTMKYAFIGLALIMFAYAFATSFFNVLTKG